jgi:hypothetical protein
MATASIEGDSSASRTRVLLSQPPPQLTTQHTGFQAGGHFTPTSSSSLHRLISNWQLNSVTHQPATSLHFTQLNCWRLTTWVLDWPCLKHFGTNHIENTIFIVIVHCMCIRCCGNPLPNNCLEIASVMLTCSLTVTKQRTFLLAIVS